LEKRVAALTEANRELEAFNYSIAHDLRTPLRSMSGFAQAMLEGEGDTLSALGLEYANRITRSAKFMDTLLQDLLTYSRLARTEMVAETIGLDDPVKEILTMMESDIQDQNARVQVISPLGSVSAHPATLKQILGNLIGNGLKFVAPGRVPELKIYSTSFPGRVRIWIEDNGIGVPPEHHEKIFGLFQRLHDNQTYPGTGIGLALVRKGAERMGGHAGLESTPGEGSRFWVDLPVEEAGLNGE
jgi:signal transduction histidine kinase